MRVCTECCRTIEEELDYLDDRIHNLGFFFSWEVHPNQVKAADISIWRLYCRKQKLIQSEEYKYHR